MELLRCDARESRLCSHDQKAARHTVAASRTYRLGKLHAQRCEVGAPISQRLRFALRREHHLVRLPAALEGQLFEIEIKARERCHRTVHMDGTACFGLHIQTIAKGQPEAVELHIKAIHEQIARHKGDRLVDARHATAADIVFAASIQIVIRCDDARQHTAPRFGTRRSHT